MLALSKAGWGAVMLQLYGEAALDLQPRGCSAPRLPQNLHEHGADAGWGVAGVQAQTRALANCSALGQLPNLSEPLFPLPENEED